MSDKIWGKVAGSVLGFAIGGPAGSFFGFIVGHAYDMRRDPPPGQSPWEKTMAETERQSVFTMSVIALGAKLAKADGRVTRAEVEAFKRVFNVSPQQENSISHIYNNARRTVSGYEQYAQRLANAYRDNRVVLEDVLGSLFIIAAADSTNLAPSEIVFLKNVSAIFGFNGEDFYRIASRAGVRLPDSERPREREDENYTILGVRATVTDEELKIAYRTLIREHHPDKLQAQGLPPEFIATATEKLKRINVAYDVICKQRGL